VDKARHKILSDAIMDEIGRVLGVPIGAAHRIVLDVEVGRPVRVYIEYYGDTRMLDIKLPELLPSDVIINEVGKPPCES
jgi:hypothetical protein